MQKKPLFTTVLSAALIFSETFSTLPANAIGTVRVAPKQSAAVCAKSAEPMPQANIMTVVYNDTDYDAIAYPYLSTTSTTTTTHGTDGGEIRICDYCGERFIYKDWCYWGDDDGYTCYRCYDTEFYRKRGGSENDNLAAYETTYTALNWTCAFCGDAVPVDDVWFCGTDPCCKHCFVNEVTTCNHDSSYHYDDFYHVTDGNIYYDDSAYCGMSCEVTTAPLFTTDVLSFEDAGNGLSLCTTDVCYDTCKKCGKKLLPYDDYTGMRHRVFMPFFYCADCAPMEFINEGREVCANCGKGVTDQYMICAPDNIEMLYCLDCAQRVFLSNADVLDVYENGTFRTAKDVRWDSSTKTTAVWDGNDNVKCDHCGQSCLKKHTYTDGTKNYCVCCAEANAAENLKRIYYPADINGNEAYEIGDVIALSRYVAGDAVTFDVDNRADFNSDNVLNMDDVALLLMCIARYPIASSLGYYSIMKTDNGSESLMKEMRPQDVELVSPTDTYKEAYDGLASKLLQIVASDEKNADANILLSPYSIVNAMAMTMNGTAGETRKNWELTLFDGLDTKTVNQMAGYVKKNMPQDALQSANAIWFRNDPAHLPQTSFLQDCLDYFQAESYAAPFNDSTLADINGFVNNQTKGRIPSILKKIVQYEDTNGQYRDEMYLVNALSFDGTWKKKFGGKSSQNFTLADGTETKCVMMGGESDYYFGNDDYTAIMKNFAVGDEEPYAFFAMMPTDAERTLDEFLADCNGTKISQIIDGVFESPIKADLFMPKFTTDFSTDLHDAFDDMRLQMKNGFTGIYEDNHFGIGSILHKTQLSVDEKGAEAAAATVVIGTMPSCVSPLVTLDRPFIYMILDTETHLPIFIGTMMNPTA